MNVNRVIFEITRTVVPELDGDGIFQVPWSGGAKIKSTQSGNVSVHYVDDADDVWRVLAVSASNTWDLPDRIDRIRDTDTTVTISNLLLGGNQID